jgi:hypothetical protein
MPESPIRIESAVEGLALLRRSAKLIGIRVLDVVSSSSPDADRQESKAC